MTEEHSINKVVKPPRIMYTKCGLVMDKWSHAMLTRSDPSRCRLPGWWWVLPNQSVCLNESLYRQHARPRDVCGGRSASSGQDGGAEARVSQWQSERESEQESVVCGEE
jgi:hypothetical protein